MIYKKVSWYISNFYLYKIKIVLSKILSKNSIILWINNVFNIKTLVILFYSTKALKWIIRDNILAY